MHQQFVHIHSNKLKPSFRWQNEISFFGSPKSFAKIRSSFISIDATMLLHSNFKQESLSCEWSTKIKTDTSIYQNLVPIKTKKKRHKNSWNDYVTKTYVFTK